MLAVLDYGAGNLSSVVNAFRHLGYQAVITDSPTVLSKAKGIILPGVGAFASAARVLRSRGLDKSIKDALQKGRPLLGICLGLQLFFASSAEGVGERGLDIVSGRVLRLPPGFKVPHMGWNQVWFKNAKDPLFQGIPDGSYFYFAHSYYPEPTQEAVSATTSYGITLPVAVNRGTAWGLQFHPEKSGSLGLKILGNFARLTEGRYEKCC